MTRAEWEFPETADWNRLSSVSLTVCAMVIAGAIADDLQTEERRLVPGLREALRLIEREDGNRRGGVRAGGAGASR